jgi:hypothetical protein
MKDVPEGPAFQPIRQTVRCGTCGEPVEIFDDFGHGKHVPVHTHRHWIGKPGEDHLIAAGVLQCQCERDAKSKNLIIMGKPDDGEYPPAGDPAWSRLLSCLFPGRTLDPAKSVPGPVQVSAITAAAIPEGFTQDGADFLLDRPAPAAAVPPEAPEPTPESPGLFPFPGPVANGAT